MPTSPTVVAALVSLLAVISFSPDPVAFRLGSIEVFWYGICYAAGIAATYVVITREARRRGLDARLVDNGIIVVAVAALLGGRLYHVIDRWDLYAANPINVILPPYTGLGVYGGIISGTLVAWYLTRRWNQPFWRWADVVAPGLFVIQSIGRWGNFFNQELYGPPTDLPWGLAIDCAHRVLEYPCASFPAATTAFQPLFLYESLSGLLGAVTLLWVARRWGSRLRPGDLFLGFLIWYSVVRLALETMRTGNWTFFGVPTAIVISAVLIAGSLAVLAVRHRPGAVEGDRWGDDDDGEGDDEDDDEDGWDEDGDDPDEDDDADGRVDRHDGRPPDGAEAATIADDRPAG